MRLAAVLLTVLALAGCVSRVGEPVGARDTAPSSETNSETAASPEESPESSGAEDSGPDVAGCVFTETPAEDAPVGLPPEEATGGDRVVLVTSDGDLVLRLTAETTPCTVHSFRHLAGSGFYDGTTCHRLTASAGLKVLQCGDPKGDGTGGPGYSIPDELPTDLADAPRDASGQQTKIYPRGTVAMANAGPQTGGSQFFLVYGDSVIPPAYTVFGTLDDHSLGTLDTIAARGVGAGGASPEDGPPAAPVTIESAEVG